MVLQLGFEKSVCVCIYIYIYIYIYIFFFLKIVLAFYVYFWPHYVACGILVPWPGIKPRFMAVKAQNPNHWTAREVPEKSIFYRYRI